MLNPQLDDLASEGKGKDCSPAEVKVKVIAKSCDPVHNRAWAGTRTASSAEFTHPERDGPVPAVTSGVSLDQR
jgi:hypothetical protein